RQEKAAVVEERSGIIKVTPVQNDGQERSRVLLTGLKTLFQKQLPKMPREYITRLVFDENSRALAIVKRGLKVVGGITFRPFPHRGFAEIVFFATASVDQVRGYGGMLMNHFKMHIRKTYPGMDHFLTYADNYAVGYFRKQGFSKEITLDRSIWAGYIKDYEGGTLMQCTMVRKVDYLCAKDMLQAQREAILSKIREHSRSHIVYEGLTCFANVPPENRKPLDPKEVPGLRETGWTADLMELAQRFVEEVQMKKLLSALQQHKMAWPFAQPVNRDEVPDYYDVIKHPMDLSLVEHKLEHHRYTSLDSFVSDCNLIFSNCLTYNPETTIYAKSALQLRKFLEQQLQALQQETS
ncbi:histone acetyltransferase, GCN5 superfamily, partial [Exidia glandulosa HHB12029]